tara:strand:+ start:24866 stop:25171 length:306 start_codon:yes stop_codon:yes gene_type:complete
MKDYTKLINSAAWSAARSAASDKASLLNPSVHSVTELTEMVKSQRAYVIFTGNACECLTEENAQLKEELQEAKIKRNYLAEILTASLILAILVILVMGGKP